MTHRKKIPAFVLACLLGMVATVFAGIVQEAYGVLSARPALVIDAGDGDDSADLDTPLTGAQAAKETLGNPTLAVNASFSNASATCLVTVVFFDSADDPKVLGLAQATATATRYRDAAAGNYVAQTLLFDTYGAPEYEVRIDDPSAGSVDVEAHVYGSQSQ